MNILKLLNQPKINCGCICNCKSCFYFSSDKCTDGIIGTVIARDYQFRRKK